MSHSIQSFKDRELNPDKPVKVYRCLTRKGTVFSVQQGGVVIGHTSELTLRDVTFKINHAGKLRAVRSGQRNVHAFVYGMIADLNRDLKRRISYFPFNDKGFYFVDTEDEITEAKEVTFTEFGLWSC